MNRAIFSAHFGDRYANELDVTFQVSSDESTPAVDWPQVEVDVASSVDGLRLRRPLRVGGQFFAQQNGLDQKSLRVTNALDIRSAGDDVVTLGLTAAYYDIAHTFLPGAAGEYYFPSFADFEANAPHRYQRSVLAEGEDAAAQFEVLEVGAFVQHQLNAGDGLTMRFGLRLDAPYVMGAPEQNTYVLDYFGYDTSLLPSGNFLLSPRFGFNWQSEGRRMTQVRGGFGWFSGQVPYVWLSNAFHNDGMRSVTYTCEGRSTLDPLPSRPAPPFSVGAPPTSCYNPEAQVQPSFNEVRSVVVFEPGFKYPQNLKFSASVDHELSDNTSFTIGFLFDKALNQIGLMDVSIEGGGTDLAGLGGTERRYYQSLGGDVEQVLVVTNEGEDWATSISAELRGRVSNRFSYQLGYALAKSWDRMSLVYQDMHSNFGFNPSESDVNRPPLRSSNFDRPHKIVATAFGAPFPGLPQSEISLLYTGQSGLPFSYVYNGDVNGDGYPGVGGALDRTNDLIHVPENPTQAPLSLITQVLMNDAIKNTKCLSDSQGSLVPRNGCRAPWENRHRGD